MCLAPGQEPQWQDGDSTLSTSFLDSSPKELAPFTYPEGRAPPSPTKLTQAQGSRGGELQEERVEGDGVVLLHGLGRKHLVQVGKVVPVLRVSQTVGLVRGTRRTCPGSVPSGTAELGSLGFACLVLLTGPGLESVV